MIIQASNWPVRTIHSGRIPRQHRLRVELLLGEHFAFMDNPIFTQRGIERSLFAFAEHGGSEPELPRTGWYQPTRNEKLDETMVSAPPQMNTAQERMMFLRYNFSRRRLTLLQKRIRRDGLTLRIAEEFLEWHRRFEHYREYIARTNLALVLAMAKRTRNLDMDFAEVVSEGNMALMRAIDKFNVDRGFKFSTYACRAIIKAFSRGSQQAAKRADRFRLGFDPSMERVDVFAQRRESIREDCLHELKEIVDRNLAELSSVEETVIRRRFNWELMDESPLTLEEVGRIVGVTKERVRQIQNKALKKIRLVMEEGVLRIRYSKPKQPPAP